MEVPKNEVLNNKNLLQMTQFVISNTALGTWHYDHYPCSLPTAIKTSDQQRYFNDKNLILDVLRV